ncbi:phosphatidylserine/phosphatidylglycerophosphate/cardiolipin synthase family protein [Aquabacterium sp.]|uniref:phospholipase D-like domain-containing protein n=1 Tax=Aquabacterium sp. TaxID=1872578 RepID=UPI00378448CE
MSALLWLAGCAGLPARPPEAPTVALAAADSPLGSVARASGLGAGQSGLWPMPEAWIALDARFELIRQATTSIDVQYYQVGDDSVGRSLLRALRDAGRRGVRVRLLVDDLYTRDLDDLLQGLAATPNVAVRLFNPFPFGRRSSTLRSLAFLTDFQRLNQRMHNKLLVADGSVAVVGGRNLADEYFLRHHEANFIDFDMLLVGTVVPQLNGLFDRYWNSPMVVPVQALASASATPTENAERFERLTAKDLAPPALHDPDMFGDAPFGVQLASHRYALLPGQAEAVADQPGKAQAGADPAPTVKDRFVREMGQARRRLTLFSPYFIPGEQGVASLRRARERGVDVRVVTNSLVASDEPLVTVGYAQYRRDLLLAGVRLFEVASDRLKSDSRIGRMLGSTAGRLHAKMALIDDEVALVGSMNLDPRSEHTNNEIGVIVRSPEVVRRMAAVYNTDRNVDYEVRLGDDRTSVVWVSHTGEREERAEPEPDPGLWQRIKLRLMWLLVPEDLL